MGDVGVEPPVWSYVSMGVGTVVLLWSAGYKETGGDR